MNASVTTVAIAGLGRSGGDTRARRLRLRLNSLFRIAADNDPARCREAILNPAYRSFPERVPQPATPNICPPSSRTCAGFGRNLTVRDNFTPLRWGTAK